MICSVSSAVNSSLSPLAWLQINRSETDLGIFAVEWRTQKRVIRETVADLKEEEEDDDDDEEEEEEEEE